jgi:hypothetical protein
VAWILSKVVVAGRGPLASEEAGMWRRGRVAVAGLLVALGLLAGCGGGGQSSEESFTPEELSAIQAATANVAVYCTNQIVQRSTGRSITGGPSLADAEAGIATLARLAREKPAALWEPTATAGGTTSETTGQTGTETVSGETTGTTPSGGASTGTAASTTGTTGTGTAGAQAGPRTLVQTLADLGQPVRVGCGGALAAQLSSAVASLTGTAPATVATTPTATATGTATASTTATVPTSPTATATGTAPASTAATVATPPTETGTPTAPTSTASAGAPPTPSVLSGAGPVASEVRISRPSPLVVTARYAGSGTFSVRLEPTGGAPGTTLFQRVGTYSGEALLAQPQPGRYRLHVEASGRWSLRLEQPRPSATARMIPGQFTGTGSRVIPAQAAKALRARITGQHQGRFAFRVTLVGYGTNAGTSTLFEQSGRFQGETVTEIPAGPYLLAVQADGAWELTFSPAPG